MIHTRARKGCAWPAPSYSRPRHGRPCGLGPGAFLRRARWQVSRANSVSQATAPVRSSPGSGRPGKILWHAPVHNEMTRLDVVHSNETLCQQYLTLSRQLRGGRPRVRVRNRHASNTDCSQDPTPVRRYSMPPKPKNSIGSKVGCLRKPPGVLRARAPGEHVDRPRPMRRRQRSLHRSRSMRWEELKGRLAQKRRPCAGR